MQQASWVTPGAGWLRQLLLTRLCAAPTAEARAKSNVAEHHSSMSGRPIVDGYGEQRSIVAYSVDRQRAATVTQHNKLPATVHLQARSVRSRLLIDHALTGASSRVRPESPKLNIKDVHC